MDRNKELAKNTIIIFIGTICTKLVSFFLLPLYTGLLNTSEYGIVDLLTTLIALIAPIVSLQISQGVFRFLIDSRNNEEDKKQIISISMFFIIASIFLYSCLFFIISPLIKNEYKYFLTINVIASIFCDLFLQISRGLGDNKEYSIAGVITAIVTIICNIFFLVGLHYRVTGMLAGTLIGYISGIAYLFLKLKLYKYISFHNKNKKMLIKLLKYSLPLVPNQISWWVFGMSDRLIVSIILGLSLTGILSVSYKFSSMYIMFYNIFNISWTESMSLHVNDKDVENYFNRIFDIIFYMFFSFGIALIAFMPLIFKVMVNKNYNLAENLIPIAILATMCQVVVGLVSVVYVSKNDTKAIANTAVCAALVNVVTHLILIRPIGIYAAVVSTFLSYFIFAVYRTIDVSKKYIKVRFNKKKLFVSIVILLSVILAYYSKYIPAIINSMIISTIYLYFINKKSIKSVINMLIKKSERE